MPLVQYQRKDLRNKAKNESFRQARKISERIIKLLIRTEHKTHYFYVTSQAKNWINKIGRYIE